MWSNLTVKDIGNYKRPQLKKKGAKLDFRWVPGITESLRVKAFTSFKKFVKSEGLIISGFGEESFSGILSSEGSENLQRKKIEKIKKWKHRNASTFSFFRIGKIQWIEDIHFE